MGAAIRRCRRAVVFNAVGSFGPGPRQNCLPGFVELSIPRELVRYLRPRLRGSFRVLYTPHAGDPEEHFYDVARLLLQVRDVVFAVDEIWLFQRGASWSPAPLKYMMLTGRHYGITLLWTAQRAAEVHRTLTSVSTELYIGRLVEDRDLAALRSRVPVEAMAQIPTLPNRAFIHRDETGHWRIER